MLNRLPITENESLLIGMDFSAQMDTDETIDSSNSNGTTAVSAVDSAAEPATIIEADSMTVAGQVLQARIEGCDADETYTVSFFAATSSGNFLEGRVQVKVS